MLTDDQKTALASELIDAKTQAESDRLLYLNQVTTVQGLLKPAQTRTNPPYEGACNLHLPLLRTIRNGLFDRIRRAILGNDTTFYVEGMGRDGEYFAPMVEAFINRQVERQMHMAERVTPALYAAGDDGTGPLYVTWREDYRKKRVYTKHQTASIGENGGLIQPGDITSAMQDIPYYDAPYVQSIPIDKVGVYPASATCVQEADGVYLMLSATWNDLLNGVASGDYEQKAIDAIAEWTGETQHLQHADAEGHGILTSDASVQPGRSLGVKHYDLVEWYFRYQPNHKEVAQDWLITLHEPTRTILRALPNPWGHGLRPIEPLRIRPIKYGIIGESLGDLAGDMQQFITVLMRLMIDGLTLQVWPEYSIGGLITPDDIEAFRENRGPGKLHHFANIDDVDKVLRAMNTNLNPMMALPMIEFLWSWAQRATGFTDTMIGKSTPKQVTATEMEAMLTEGQEGVMSMVDTISNGLSRIGSYIFEMDYDYMAKPSVQQVWLAANPESSVDEMFVAMQGQYDILAAGTKAATNAAMRRQVAMEMYAWGTNNPLVQADPTGKRFYQVSRRFLTDYAQMRESEVKAIIGTEEEAQMIAQAQQAAQMFQQAQAAGDAAYQAGLSGEEMDANIQPAAGGLGGLG